MSKNMTRKGLAFGSAFALGASLIATAPAVAAGTADGSVSLLPNVGTEYTVLSDQYIDLKANYDASLAANGRYLKFLVEDTQSQVFVDVDVNGAVAGTAFANARDIDSVSVDVTGTNAIVTVNTVFPHQLLTGDVVDFSGTFATSGTTIDISAGGNYPVTRVDADSFTVDIGAKQSVSAVSETAGKFTFVSTAVTAADPTAGGTSVTFTVDNAAQFRQGDKVTFSSITFGGTDPSSLTTNEVTNVDIATNKVTVSFAASTGAISALPGVMTMGTAADEETDLAARNVIINSGLGNERVLGDTDYDVAVSGRDADDKTFVVTTIDNSVANDMVLRLASALSTTTYSVKVTAWVDNNGNNEIDATEKVSPTRTVTFVRPSSVVGVTTLAPVVGDATLKASVTTTPVLNGQQVLVQDKNFLNAAFTRSLSADTVYGEADKGSGDYANATAVWNDTTKVWTIEVSLDADAADEASSAAGVQLADAWTDIASPAGVTPNTSTIAISTAGVVTVVTANDHLLRTGDKITMVSTTAGIELAAENTGRTVTVTGARSFTYTVSETTGLPTTAIAATSASTTSEYTLATYSGPKGLIDRVGAETYTAQAYIVTATGGSTWTAISNKAESGVASAATATATASTTASAAVQGKTFTAVGTNTVKVLTGTKSVAVTFTALDVDGDALGAGRPVVVALSASGTVDTFRVNGKTADTVLTDANGQATVTITAANGYDGAMLQVTGTIENAASADVDLKWEDQAFGLYDLGITADMLAAGTNVRAMQELGSYDLQLAVMDQWFTAAPAATYRLRVYGEGATAQFVTLNNGRATVKVTDTGVFGTQVQTDIDLQKLNGTTVISSATLTYNFVADVVKTFKVNVGAAGSTLYGNAVVASAPVAEKALLELDKRVAAGVTPAYGTSKRLVLNGSVVNAATSAGRQGALVTVTGPSNILFSSTDNLVAKRGSLTFLAGSNGNFEIHAYSTTAQKDTVITFTSNGVTGTIKVSFTGTGVGEGTLLVVTTPEAVKPASTFQVKAKLTDVYGNAVDTAAGRMKVTYNGAGIVFGTLPTETDANGELMFSVLLGSNDTGNVVVTVSYDQNADTDFVDAKDLNTTKTIVINASGTVSAGKVNVGSFNGKLVVYASGLNGARISWKVGGVWGVGTATSNYSIFNRPTPRAGVTVSVDIYVNGVKTLTKSVLTR